MGDKLSNIGRWIAIIPVVPIVYMLSKIFSDLGWSYMDSEAIYYAREYRTIEHAWITGSIYTFQTEAVAVGFSIVAGVKMAPAYRLQTGVVLAVLSTIFVVLASVVSGYAAAMMDYTAGQLIYLILATLGSLAGISGGLYYLYEEGELSSGKKVFIRQTSA